MKKREFVFLIAIVAVLTGVTNYWSLPSEEIRTEVSQENLSLPREPAKLLWKVQPTYYHYREFSIEVSKTEGGAAWSASLVASSEEQPCRLEGRLSSEEWNQFLSGFQKAGGWQWRELGPGEEPQPTDQPYYTLDIPDWGSQRVYGLPTERHVEFANFMDRGFVGRAESLLDKECAHRRPGP